VGLGEFRGRAMPFFVYVAILFTAVFSVALEWDALVVPSTKTWHEIRQVSEFGKAPAQPAGPQTAASAAEQKPVPKTAAVTPAPVNAAGQVKTGDEALAAGDAQPQKTAAPLCDVNACAAAYFSFRASDCTYQPNFGPRRLCTRGAAANAPAAVANAEAPAGVTCHYRTCAEHYSSFNPQDCTYQPLEGPRRVCEK